jgi:fatty acid desaturase
MFKKFYRWLERKCEKRNKKIGYKNCENMIDPLNWLFMFISLILLGLLLFITGIIFNSQFGIITGITIVILSIWWHLYQIL